MLVTNALAAVNIRHHGWPVSYFALGDVVTFANAMPGDLVYYENGGLGLAHIAVYDGGGMAIHGGWNGNQTIRASVWVGSGPVFIRVR
jgi:cell wall-associated NlpC family hydrolase